VPRSTARDFLAFPEARCRLYVEKFGLHLVIWPMPDWLAAEYEKVVHSNNHAFDGVFQCKKTRGLLRR
jgi:hypothetical protein